MRQRTTATLYAYWNEVRQGRMAPRRFDIEPSQIASVLPDTFMLERSPNGSFTYRLAGTRICSYFQKEFRGNGFLEDWNAADKDTLVHYFQEITSRGGVGLFTFECGPESGEKVRFEMIVLPLVHTMDSINRYLGAVSPINAPAWLGSLELGKKALISHELIWPEGKPHMVAERQARQLPFHAHVRHARIVRNERRQFRVYEGGLFGSEADKR
jgi:hypothetical protein